MTNRLRDRPAMRSAALARDAKMTALVFFVAVPMLALGYAIAHIGPVPIWELLAVCLLALVIILPVRTTLTHPLVLFPTLYLTYFLVGSQNWTERAGYVSFRTFIDTNAFLRLPVLGLVAYMAGVAIVSYKTVVLPKSVPSTISQSRTRFTRAGKILALLGIGGVIATLATHGLLITNPTARSVVSGWQSGFAIAVIPAAVLLAIGSQRSITRFGLLAGTSLLLLVVLGYRIFVVVLILSYIIFTVRQGRMRQRTVAIGVVALVFFALIVNDYRAGRNGTADVYGTIIVPTATQPLAQLPALTSLYNSIPHEGASVFNRLVEIIPADHAFMHGHSQLGTFEAPLPGKQVDARTIATELIDGTTSYPTVLVPTILGAPYMDFGLVGIIVEMGLLGAFIAYLYQRSRQSGSAVATLAYAYFLAVAITGIHTGILDTELELGIPALTALAMWISPLLFSQAISADTADIAHR